MRLVPLISLGLLSLVTVTAVSCGGGGSYGSGDDDDDDGGTPTPEVVEISGTTLDYFTTAPVASALFGTEGLDPELGGASDGAGHFTLVVPSTATFRLRVSGVSGYRATSGHSITTEFAGVTGIEAPLVASADVLRQYNSVGETPGTGVGALVIDLVDPAGVAIEGIPAADILLLDTAENPVTTALGPYFFATGGDMVDNGTLAISTAFGGRARAGFLDVPPGDYHATVTWSSGGTIVEVGVPFSLPSVDGVALRRLYPPPSGE